MPIIDEVMVVVPFVVIEPIALFEIATVAPLPASEMMPNVSPVLPVVTEIEFVP